MQTHDEFINELKKRCLEEVAKNESVGKSALFGALAASIALLNILSTEGEKKECLAFIRATLSLRPEQLLPPASPDDRQDLTDSIYKRFLEELGDPSDYPDTL